ncbi:MAG TPA: cellulase family glycosylhydrolase, partial [Armatimonadota bacterium]|nr:cellulase family glycosylhydrolase [Armatimonadota bacterium]
MKFLIACVIVLGISVVGWATKLPSSVVPDGLGVNIHFTGEPARDLDMIQAGGWKFIRMDFHWGAVEKQKGVYNFTPYDILTDALAKRGIRALFILDYGNSLYEPGDQMHLDSTRQAFAQFAAAAATHFRNRGVIWELWNEPDGSWRPAPDVDEYMALAKVVFPAIRKADPSSCCIAPATGVNLPFLDACFQRGLLDMVDAISLHPYRQGGPESVADDYA